MRAILVTDNSHQSFKHSIVNLSSRKESSNINEMSFGEDDEVLRDDGDSSERSSVLENRKIMQVLRQEIEKLNERNGAIDLSRQHLIAI